MIMTERRALSIIIFLSIYVLYLSNVWWNVLGMEIVGIDCFDATCPTTIIQMKSTGLPASQPSIFFLQIFVPFMELCFWHSKWNIVTDINWKRETFFK